ncbi:D-alanyl-lipoteichoic acid acyltransferase DltB, MBOAT superfamily [Pseudarcicella hirudinis]|uniref:D-alanyl-lipoteichoic acid acyltransferase DltB, MBOAT superfamily n=1 Tax=Pseudarcicella hirudinis TaxID=1079859 RepID=A0A1I5VG86_9BACT|nr:MBOAT family O-acyltransferase [Pseudarcicella hirudinis]SFQ06515.1 D-alanyl-lipoteichoic acid acyltransferase DltB, MBOAT superfamily [Pseudarcicella hirudinis]
MVFNSLHFLLFFIIVTLAYFSLGLGGRWKLLLLASCYFYMIFRPEYIIILFVTIIIDYFAGIWIEKAEGYQRKLLLVISLISNIGILAYFKYFNFFNENLGALLWHFDIANPIPYTSFILPIGLSFHTFQAMSYTIEVYRGNQKSERNFGIYALYVMFYPQLVAGPIERPQNVLHQFHEFHAFDWEKVKSGLLLMAWGFFKKVVIAERLGMLVDYAYKDPHEKNGITLLVATIFYAFQIYCDFSGYSDIALGSARVMGYDLMENFKSPYFSRSISEFWSRWHISLSSWFRDYLYIPLGGNRKGEFRRYLNQFIIFMVSGLWHGAKWTFVVWGCLHGTYLVLAIVRNKYFPKMALPDNFWGKSINLVFTFSLVTLSWVFFRAVSMKDSFLILKKIFTLNIHEPLVSSLNTTELIFSVLLIMLLMLKERFYFYVSTSDNKRFALLFAGFVIITYFFGVFNTNQFIYFQF